MDSLQHTCGRTDLDPLFSAIPHTPPFAGEGVNLAMVDAMDLELVFTDISQSAASNDRGVAIFSAFQF
jgi:2-polyprenyl-6-methoxyphenol hydroxylase-like FAD-dependent oxidoreductase